MVFHKYRLIVIGVPKNASTSIFEALKNLTDKNHDHETIIDTYTNHDSDLVEHYTSIAVVRNPYDRFFSSCHQIRRDDEHNTNLTVSEIIDQEIKGRNGWVNDVFQPQFKYVSIGGKLLVDKLFKYENLKKEFEDFSIEFNKTSPFPIPKNLPLYNNSTNKIPWKEEFSILTQEELDLINKLYFKDFKMFGYKMIEDINNKNNT